MAAADYETDLERIIGRLDALEAAAMACALKQCRATLLAALVRKEGINLRDLMAEDGETRKMLEKVVDQLMGDVVGDKF